MFSIHFLWYFLKEFAQSSRYFIDDSIHSHDLYFLSVTIIVRRNEKLLKEKGEKKSNCPAHKQIGPLQLIILVVQNHHAGEHAQEPHWNNTNKGTDFRFNPLGPKSDQHQFSPNNISRSSRVKVMRITKLITKGRML